MVLNRKVAQTNPVHMMGKSQGLYLVQVTASQELF